MSDKRPLADEGEHRPPERGEHPFWPVHVVDEAMLIYLVIGIVMTLAILHPFGLHGQADPLNTPEAIKPEWYFLSMYQFLKYVPKVVGVMLVGVFFGTMFLWPFIDELIYRKVGHRRLSTVVGWGILILISSLSTLGYLSESTMHFGSVAVEFDIKARPHLLTGKAAQARPAEEAKAAPSEAPKAAPGEDKKP